MAEIRPIPGFPDYFADTDGNVWSQKGKGSNQYSSQPSSKALRLLKPIKAGKVYKKVTLKKDGIKYGKYIHHIILETFISERPKGLDACHGIKGKECNALENLSWKTRKENNFDDKIRDGTLIRGTKHWKAHLSEEQVREIRNLRGIKTQEALGKMFHTSSRNINDIQQRNTWDWLQ